VSIGRATTSSAPASRNAIRSSTSSLSPTHITGTEASAGAARRSRHTSTADLGPPVRSMMTSWCSGAFANASSGEDVRVTV
jgi:hypothetical protein